MTRPHETTDHAFQSRPIRKRSRRPRGCEVWRKAFEDNLDPPNHGGQGPAMQRSCLSRGHASTRQCPQLPTSLHRLLTASTSGQSKAATDRALSTPAQVVFNTRRQRPRKPKAEISSEIRDHSGAIPTREKAIQEPSRERVKAAQVSVPVQLAKARVPRSACPPGGAPYPPPVFTVWLYESMRPNRIRGLHANPTHRPHRCYAASPR